MGWSDCGMDSKGRPIGYAFEAKCDHPGCEKDIDRGLSYACGDMHGDNEIGCEGYYCERHKANWAVANGNGYSVCDKCADHMSKSEYWTFDEFECEFVRLD